MSFSIEAACVSDKGRMRSNHEDNFFFGGQYLQQKNDGLSTSLVLRQQLRDTSSVVFAVFDGMGGENYGEIAAFSAAEKIKKILDNEPNIVADEGFLKDLAFRLNEAVVSKQDELFTDRMGTTMVVMSVMQNRIFVCNVGDSRAYRLRGKEFLQLSEDHISPRERNTLQKSPLLQYLGLDPEEVCIVPHIEVKLLQAGDMFLLCSDGLTDMLSNLEIEEIMESADTVKTCADQLLDASLEKGGQDNITVIVSRIVEDKIAE